MSWVSYTKLKSLCDSLRSKMVSNEFLLANSDKSKGVHVNLGGQDGLMTLSPINEDGVTPAALWVTDSEANNATELTGGTLSYVTDVGESGEDYTSLSLVGGVVNVSGKSGAQRRITNVATPTGDNDAVNKKYVDSFLPIGRYTGITSIKCNLPSSTEWTKINTDNIVFDKNYPFAIGHMRIEANISANGTAHYRVFQLENNVRNYIIPDFYIHNPTSSPTTFNFNVPFDYYDETFNPIQIEAKLESGTTINSQLLAVFYMNIKAGYLNKAI